jgi:hypothetical protein
MQNFGKIKASFNNVLAESIVTKDKAKKDVFKKYISTIKENEILKNQFLVYNNIETKIESDEFKATEFVKENLSILSAYNKKDIVEANKKLASILESIEDVEDDKTQLYENITTLLFTTKTPSNVDTIVETTNKIVKYILNNKSRVVVESFDLPNSMLRTIFVDKYNEKYNELDESEKAVLKVLIDSNDEQKKEVYSKTLRECIDLIDAKLNTSDLDVKDKLLKVKDRLLNDKQEITEDFSKNISKLIELRTNLKDN